MKAWYPRILGLFFAACPASTTWATDCSQESITLNTQAQVNSFQDDFGGGGICDTVTGALVITGADISNLNALSDLTAVGQDLDIQENDALVYIDGLSNLTSLGNDLFISSNISLTHIALSNLVSVSADVRILGNPLLTNLDELGNLISVGNDIFVDSNEALAQCSGLIPLLDAVDDGAPGPGPGPGGVPDVGSEIFLQGNLTGCNSIEEIFNSQAEPTELVLIAEFGGFGSAVGQFNTPMGVAIDNQGQIIVADAFNSRIQVCDRSGNCTAFGTAGTEAGQFSPTDVAVDSQNRIIVVDSGNHRMQVCNHQGNCTPFGGLGSQLGRFNAPIAVAVDSEDRMVIGDQFNGRVQICDAQGICNSIGHLVKDPMNFQAGEFGFIKGVAVDQQDRILVTENIGGSARKTLQSCSPDCSVIKTFEIPSYIAVDHFNRIYVVENGEVHRCDHAGLCEILQMAGDSFWGKGLAFTQANELVVSYHRDHQIRIFATTPTFKINPGLNDAWFNPATNGQGFLITVFPEIKQMFLAWFTYDTERPPEDVTAMLGGPGQRWLTAQGPYEGDTANLTIFVTEGGVFDAAEPAATGEL
jgi:hypothetical protein